MEILAPVSKIVSKVLILFRNRRLRLDWVFPSPGALPIVSFRESLSLLVIDVSNEVVRCGTMCISAGLPNVTEQINGVFVVLVNVRYDMVKRSWYGLLRHYYQVSSAFWIIQRL